MTDIPIIFSGPMVLALLREAEHPGTGKTMTRRMFYAIRRVRNGAIPASASILQDYRPPCPPLGPSGFPTDIGADEYYALTGWQRVRPGDKLWVRERLTQKLGTNFLTGEPLDFVEAAYAADGADVVLHMPRAVSRLTLTVTGTKIERVQDISDADAKAEGALLWAASDPVAAKWPPVKAFIELWETLHGENAWSENPWLVALTFTVAARNIDRLAEAA